jgi:uncharacterized protein YndB with AHSA1/START domain
LTSPAESSPRAVADLTSGTILASVEIAASPERVFQAISSAEVAEWWGSAETYRVTRWTGDVRAGGWWRSEGISATGQPFAVGGDILEVEPPRLFVHTWRYEHKPGDVTTVRYVIEPIPGGSRVTVRHSGFTDRESCEGHAQGWERVLAWLTSFVTRAQS